MSKFEPKRDLVTASEAADELGVTSRHVKRILKPAMILPGPTMPRLYSRADVEAERTRRAQADTLAKAGE